MSEVYQGSAPIASGPRGRWQRVSRRRPCPKCGGFKWCSFAPRGDAVKCMDEPSDHPCRDGGWLHRIEATALDVADLRPFVTSPEAADPDTLHRVYSAWLDLLYLDAEHRELLQTQYGIVDAACDWLRFKTMPGRGRARLVRELVKQFGPEVLARVPGFIWIDTTDGGYWWFGGPVGILLPVFDVYERIVALMLRPDDRDQFGRYMFCSSASRGGPSCGAPVHVPPIHVDSGDVYLVEGGLKGSAVACLAGVRVVGLSGGCGSWRAALPALAEMRPERVILCFDNDASAKEAVAKAQRDAFRRLRADGFEVHRGDWPSEFKGPDDSLRAGCTIEVLP